MEHGAWGSSLARTRLESTDSSRHLLAVMTLQAVAPLRPCCQRFVRARAGRQSRQHRLRYELDLAAR
eukprot:1304157-Rhodomonas_salina.1